MKVIGIVGGIGSGKSEVARLLEQMGGRLVSGDETGHEALRVPNLKDRIVQRWGEQILNEQKEIDRKKLGVIVFQNPEERAHLEQIVHPWIKDELKRKLDELRSQAEARFLILDAAILLEAGWNDVCDQVIFVEVPDEMRYRRLQETRGWSREEAQNRELAQWPLKRKKEHADFVLDNVGTREDLYRKVEELVQQIV